MAFRLFGDGQEDEVAEVVVVVVVVVVVGLVLRGAIMTPVGMTRGYKEREKEEAKGKENRDKGPSKD